MASTANAQSIKYFDTGSSKIKVVSLQLKDTVQHLKDSLLHRLKTIPVTVIDNKARQINESKKRVTNSLNGIKNIKTGSIVKSLSPVYSFKNIFIAKPLLQLRGGYIAYNMNYRSNIDTPVIEYNIVQNSVSGSLNLSVASIPLRVNYLLRRSNSTYFRDINDVQVEFDGTAFRNQVQSNLQQRLLSFLPALKDTLLEAAYKFKLQEFNKSGDLFNSPTARQKLLEYNEILSFPDVADSRDSSGTPSKKEARAFIDDYNKRKAEWDALTRKKDSLEQAYLKMQTNIESYKNLVKGTLSDLHNPAQLKEALEKYGLKNIKIPARYQWLMNVRKFGVGRSQLNYSELTSKNISLTGVNFEYNSWYYVAVAAGTVDYRFRDFVVNRFNRAPQFMYMARLGVGKLESNCFIVSVYKGQKQLFAGNTTGSGIQTININGFAAEAKIKLASSTYLIAEAAQSLSPDFRKNPVITQKFDFTDQSNKAFSLKAYSYIRRTNSRIEAMYKYTGANFQSFSSFQTNSTVKAWSIKADQQFFNRKLKISASVKTNDFSNPYIIQNYKSNTVFKSLQATFRAKHLPMITIGYVPISQLTYVDSVLTENRFQSLNAGLTHFYKLGTRSATSSFIYNRFYNTINDSSFAYYNAENIFFNQTVDFALYAMTLSVSHSKSPGFELNVLDAGLNWKAGKFGTVGFGVKVNDFDKLINSTGFYSSIQVNMGKLGVLSGVYDDGFLPGNNHRFIRNRMMNINFIRQL